MKLRSGRPAVTAALIVALTGSVEAAGTGADGNADARGDFLELCSGCHGEDARGGGQDAKNLTKTPPDLTQIRRRAGGRFDKKAIFDWIIGLDMPAAHGTREMPIWGDWLIDEALDDSTSLEAADAAVQEVEGRVNALVDYLETLQTER